MTGLYYNDVWTVNGLKRMTGLYYNNVWTVNGLKHMAC